MPHIHPNIVRQVFTLLLIGFIGILLFRSMIPFMTGVLGAITLYIMLKGWMRHLVLERKWKAPWAATILLIFSFFVILIPLTVTVAMITTKLGSAVTRFSEFVEIIRTQIHQFESKAGFEISSNFNMEQIGSVIGTQLENLVGNTLNVIIAIGIMYFLLYFMLVNRRQFIESLYTYLPFKAENITVISDEVNSIVKSNAIGIPLVAILQGIVALIGFLILGVPNPWFWFVITAIGSMIPFIGTAIGIGPVIIILFASGQNWQGITMLIYGLVVVGSTDNLFRLVVQKRLANIHPLITLVGVVVGVPIFGFLGLIFGPLLISLFLLLLKIYKKEFIDIHLDNDSLVNNSKRSKQLVETENNATANSENNSQH